MPHQPSRSNEEIIQMVKDYRYVDTVGAARVCLMAIRQALQAKDAERERAVEEALRNVPVGFVRQWINEDLLKDGHKLVDNEDIQSFINIALTPKVSNE